MGEKIPDFDRDADGGVTLFPVVTCLVTLFGGMTVGLRVEYQPHRDRNAATSVLQLALTPEQCVELSRLLLELARQAAAPPPAGTASS